ncbi:uncharacterized protein LOC114250610 [Bombyx mandarina]|uniref:Uncharacterized protein LOC114250610 n=2 Tax=Bombyx TaxID=7090 RepID=A0A6J2KEE0_BOMMA|nr:uncharacterized protein LOC114250610 [Bombyx mandarina]
MNATKQAQTPQPRPLPPAPSNMNEAWTTVVRRGGRKAQASLDPRLVPAAAAPQAMGRTVAGTKKKGRKPRKPRAPRSAAVVLELLPAAKEKGLTYGEVMAQARCSVDIDAIGVEGGIRVRHTANGARLLECPGADSGVAADKLATRLREILPDSQVVRIERPVRMAEIKVTGLDECATKVEVAAAIASQGNCALAQVKVGELRSCYSGTFTVWARCPVQAAILLATPPQGRPADSPGKLRVGWVIAHVQLQEARPWRCLRCFGTGHGLARCPSSVDRSGLCFRCGQPGHKAASCTAAAPHCVLCDAVKRRALF